MAASGRLALSLRGVLRFVVLLAAACLVGALVGLLTEPLEHADRSATSPRKDAPPSNPLSVDDAGKAEGKTAVAAALGLAEDDPTATNGKEPAPIGVRADQKNAFESLAPDLRGLYVGCGVLAVFVLAAVFLARRQGAARTGNGVIHVVDTLHLGAGRRVHLLRCEGRKYLIANTEKGVSFIASVPQNDVERAFDAEVAATPAEEDASEGEPGFERMLGKSFAGGAHR